LLKIRKEERDSFDRYRHAISRLLNEITNKKKRIARQEVKEMFRDKIEPELLRMRSELTQEQKKQTRRIVGGLGAVAASIALGAFGQIVPAATVGVVGTSLITEAAKSTCAHGASLKERNDFYFLLRLITES